MRLRTRCLLGVACLLACPSNGLADDLLKIENIADGDNVVVLMDSRTFAGANWQCSNDTVLRTTGALPVGRRDADAGCNSEIAVFAAGNAMALSFPGWSDADGDIHTITMKPIIDVPVSVWIADAAAEARAPGEIANATWVYTQNKVGVQFVATYNNVYDDPNAVA